MWSNVTVYVKLPALMRDLAWATEWAFFWSFCFGFLYFLIITGNDPGLFVISYNWRWSWTFCNFLKLRMILNFLYFLIIIGDVPILFVISWLPSCNPEQKLTDLPKRAPQTNLMCPYWNMFQHVPLFFLTCRVRDRVHSLPSMALQGKSPLVGRLLRKMSHHSAKSSQAMGLRCACSVYGCCILRVKHLSLGKMLCYRLMAWTHCL